MAADQYRLGMQGKHRDHSRDTQSALHCNTEYTGRGRKGEKDGQGVGRKGGKERREENLQIMYQACMCVSIICVPCGDNTFSAVVLRRIDELHLCVCYPNVLPVEVFSDCQLPS